LIPLLFQAVYDNGIESSKTFNDETRTYYPNGSIESVSKQTKEGKENVTKISKWFANGLMASVIINTRNESGSIDRYLTVWDTQGKQIVQNGEGNFEYCERKMER